jgi:hypothetical protein
LASALASWRLHTVALVLQRNHHIVTGRLL